MGMPLAWHRRHAVTIAGQLPENIVDARLVREAVTELVEGFLSKGEAVAPPERPQNVLPFGTAN